MTPAELDAAFVAHAAWWRGDAGGKRADLSAAYLRGADLSGADLRGACLREAYLRGACLHGANLWEASLRGAYLCGANLCEANLRGASLSEAYLRGADLCETDLRGASLTGADLSGAGLSGADLSGADLRGACLHGANLWEASLRGAYLDPHQICPQEGAFVAYKKVDSGVITLEIPADAKRTTSLVGRKCRAGHVRVLKGSGKSARGGVYVEGEIYRPDSYDDDIRVECSNGVHFFMTQREAEEW